LNAQVMTPLPAERREARWRSLVRVEVAPGKTLVPCEGGPCQGYGFLVEYPLPLEIERDPVGIYVLDDTRTDPAYVYVRDRL